MPQGVSETEQLLDRWMADLRKLAASGPRLAVNPLVRLEQLARRGPDEAWFVVLLLDQLADHAERRTAAGRLPDGERQVWERVGARFDDGAAAARTQVRAAAAFADLVARSVHGDAAMAQTLGVDPSRISQRLADRSLYAFSDGTVRHFPHWQLDASGHRAVPGLRVVLGALDPALHPLQVDHFVTTANVDLEADGTPLSPVAWLTTGGDPGKVADLAAQE
jgi:hypothetical protein